MLSPLPTWRRGLPARESRRTGVVVARASGRSVGPMPAVVGNIIQTLSTSILIDLALFTVFCIA